MKETVLISKRGADMTVAVEAIYEDGVLKLEKPIGLKEHSKVRVVIEAENTAKEAAENDGPTGWKAIDALIGIGQTVDSDASEKHDDYLYNDPHA